MVEVCVKCGIEKPFTPEYFCKSKNCKSGLRKTCRECRKKIAMEYHKTHREQESIRQKIYLKVNKDHKAEYDKQYRLEHPSERRILHQRRKARKRSLINTFTTEQWEKIKDDFNNQCAYCGKNKPLTQDHFVALSNGGEYTISNIVPACQSCNSSKGSRPFSTWYKLQPFYNKQREGKVLKYLGYKNSIQQIAFV